MSAAGGAAGPAGLAGGQSGDGQAAALAAHIARLEDHRRLCELSGRYAEAAAAAARVRELRGAQAARLRGDLGALHRAELAAVQERHARSTASFDAGWRARVGDYEAGVAAQQAALCATHDAAVAAFDLAAELQRPAKPVHSGDYIAQRRTEELLVKQGAYRKAHALKVAADGLFVGELAATHAAWDADVQLRRAKLLIKQQGEADAALQRAARGRDELELRRLDEAQRRHNRLRCVVQGLEGMHRLETVQLESWLEGGAEGAFAPLRESAAFRRKREQLLASL
ncbi:hypothetical protein HT031_002891 [Scenedesmus sp. PABB004]|nr:hypothetical protein HT031_002891 [Scenedesmus sp. PABB004]